MIYLLFFILFEVVVYSDGKVFLVVDCVIRGVIILISFVSNIDLFCCSFGVVRLVLVMSGCMAIDMVCVSDVFSFCFSFWVNIRLVSLFCL